jgi:ABC-2 type transport system permease protein
MKTLVIAWRELGALISSPTGWMVMAGFLLVTGVMWTLSVYSYVAAAGDLLANPYSTASLNLTDWLLGPWFGNVSVILVLVLPALSMRGFAEEVKQRSLELLLTAPVSSLEIVLGKYLGVLGFSTLMLLFSASGPAMLFVLGDPDPGAVAAGYLGLMLLAGCCLAVGLLASAFTENQVTALVISFTAVLVLYLIGLFDNESPDSWQAQLSLSSHLLDLFRGAVRLSDLTYYLVFQAFFLFATWQRVEGFRWR